MIQVETGEQSSHSNESIDNKSSKKNYASVSVYEDDDTEVNENENVFDNEQDNDDGLIYKLFHFKYLEFLKFNFKPNVYILLGLLAIKSIGFSFSNVPSYELSKDKIVDSFPDNLEKGESEFLKYQTLQGIFKGIVALIACSKLGIMSDHHGRVFIFRLSTILSLLGVIISLYIYSNKFVYNRHTMLFLDCIGSLDGSELLTGVISKSYISDIVSEKDRMLFLSLISGTDAGISIVSPLLSSFAVKKLGNYFTIYITAGCQVLFFLGLCLFLHESTSEVSRKQSRSEHRRYIKNKKAINVSRVHEMSKWEKVYHFSKLDSVFEVFKPLKFFYLPKSPSGSLIPRINVLILLITELLVMGPMNGFFPALLAYSMLNLGWGSVEINYFLSIDSAAKFVSAVFFPKFYYYLLENYFGFKYLSFSIDRIDILNLNIFVIIVMLAFAAPVFMEKNGVGIYINSVLLGVIAFAVPTPQNAVLKYCDKKNAGQIFTAFAILNYSIVITIPPIFLWIFSLTKNSWPTLFLIIPTGLSFLAFILLKFIRIVEDPDILNKKTDAEVSDDDENGHLLR